ncbi:cobalamin B12-binding domain-containing protein [Thalassovita sp.]|uniref:cobalamin B12-binding domain-containing protein n=1 Tax=Thalassovita sp. TaxID=1979401 RepID=UPI0029DE5F3F|nr:cobalamin-dependent protein [Thalassovita sp.]
MTATDRKNTRGRVLVAKVGLDGHDRGAKVLTRMLGDEGFDVLYLGVRSTARQIAETAREDGVDAIAISLLSGAHVEVAHAIRAELDAAGIAHVAVSMGGLIPVGDAEALHAAGVSRCFHPGRGDDSPAGVASVFDELVAQSRAGSPSKS